MTYLIIEHPDIHEELKKELAEAIPDPENIPSWQVLEKIPLLSSVVKESLRLVILVPSKDGTIFMDSTNSVAIIVSQSALFPASHALIPRNPSNTKNGPYHQE